MRESVKNSVIQEPEPEPKPGGQKEKIPIEEIKTKNSIKNIEELSSHMPLNAREENNLKQVIKTYHMRVTPYYLSLIKDLQDPLDPVRMQCIPSIDEINDSAGETIDPLGEEKTSPTSYSVHRYPDRVLLLVTGRCFMYCRHCTRKRLWQDKIPEPTMEDINEAIQYIKKNKKIREVVVSGGDPLFLSTAKIDHILSAVSELKHIEVIRIGTRTPVVFPQRIDEALCKVLEKYEKLWINVQFNHPREITPQSTAACRKIQKCGIPISNQSVLLKGINDDPKIMTELCQRLQSIRIRAYYLFQCDPVVGTGHFRTSVWKGVEIIEKMRGHTSGMCIPTFVVDGIDGKGKVPLEPNYLVSMSDEGITLRNYKNEVFFYQNPGGNTKKAKPPDKNTSFMKNKNSIKTIGIAYNLKRKGADDDSSEEYDEIETIEALKKELEKYKFNVVLLEQDEYFLKNVLENKPDFVFNIAEGIGNSRARESQIPCILESLKIPYSGSDPIALGITLDKHLTNILLNSAGVPVPKMFMVKNTGQADRLKNIFNGNMEKFIVKPRWEGSSKGIFLNSIVYNLEELKDRAGYIISKYRQPALVEEFLTGDEITAGVYGNGRAHFLDMMKIVPRNNSNQHFLYSIENKREWENKIKYEPKESIPENIQASIKKYALEAFSALELKDIARIDFRLDENNIPKIIDINPLPGLSPVYSDLIILYRLAGKDYSDLINLILKETFKRHGFKFNNKPER